MLLFCNQNCAEVWKWESSFQQCLVLFLGALWPFHQGSGWWKRDDLRYDCRSPAFKCKWNSPLQDNLSLTRSCQLGTMGVRNIIKLVRTTAILCIKKNSLLHTARHKIYVLWELRWAFSTSSTLSNPFTQTSWAPFPSGTPNLHCCLSFLVYPLPVS